MSSVGRPRTELGTWGTLSMAGLVQREGTWVVAPTGTKPTRWRARTRVRDLDGKTRPVEKVARTKAAAERELTKVLLTRTTPTVGSVLRDSMTLAAAAELWLTKIRRPESKLSASSIAQYAGCYARNIEKAPLASHTLRDANSVPVLRTFLESIADSHGSGTAKTTRSVLSSILTMAVDDGVLTHNAARAVRPPRASTPKAPVLGAERRAALGSGVDATDAVRDTRRAFTDSERQHLLDYIATDTAALRADAVDLARWMAGLGVRMAEALGQSWDDVDLDAGTVRVRGTKTVHSDRVLHLPPWLVDRLRERCADGVDVSRLVFSSPRTGGPRDERNVYRALRLLLDRAGYPWATSHSFRRTVASRIDDAGLSIALAANVLGHADPSMTARYYLGRKSDTSRAASVL